ncbi:MAG: CPBP family intramembrane glutamic endopeptidase, partial [Myxococcota bacterium]|nr:CPBP family intramembrane glutamic endopeptidase [Myxococcota bacterium]
ERSAWIVRDLATLSGGDPSQDSSMLRGALLERAASDWLMKRVEARHLRNANRSAEAEVAVAAAREHATSDVRRYTFLSLIGFVLFLLGSILVLAWPWVRRTLHRSGHLGLGEHPSPFAVHSTGRVLSLWFLAFILTGLLLSGAGRPAEGVFASTTMALVLGSQTLLHGIVALVLIQRLGRSQGPHLPLTIPLRLGFTTAMRGGRGLFVWTIGGLSLGVVAVLSATVISEIVFGSSADTQSALELFAGMSDAGAQMIVAFSVVALAPFFEEVLFRGFVYRNLRDSLGVAGAVIVSSILFAVVHMEPQLILPLGGLGAVLAISFELSGSLIVPILVHAAWNLGGLLNILVLAEG